MKRSGLLIAVIGSSLLLGGAMFTAPRVGANPSLLYLAGQAKMALGDTDAGLQLMTRAARLRQGNQVSSQPQTKPAAAQQQKSCSNRTAVQPAKATIVAQSRKARKSDDVAAQSAYVEPKVMMAAMHFPSDPFNGRADVPGMTREQVDRVRAEYATQMHQWAASQRQLQDVEAQRLVAKAMPLRQHVQMIKVVVPDAPLPGEFAPAPPKTTP